jgi:hypothetical protein
VKTSKLVSKPGDNRTMSSRLRQYLIDAYESRRSVHLPEKLSRDTPIQIDDQDDSDLITEFCNIFCTVGKMGQFRIEIVGNYPMTREIIDLADIYDGGVEMAKGRLWLQLTPDKIDVLMDLADKVRKTAFLGDSVKNPNWLRVSARTISSLYRFVRIIKEYRSMKRYR